MNQNCSKKSKQSTIKDFNKHLMGLSLQYTCVLLICYYIISSFILYLWDIPKLILISNITSILFLLVIILFIIKKYYSLSFYLISLVIILNSFFATHQLGYHSGFATFLIILIPFTAHCCNGSKISKFLLILISGLLLVSLSTIYYAPSYYPSFLRIQAANIIGVYLITAAMALFYYHTEQTFKIKLENDNVTLNKIVDIDPLTGLLNRRGLDRIIALLSKKIITENDCFSIILIDIDDFKVINDTYGHDIGDLVLVKLADIFDNNIRKSDYSSRWGGEEFMLLIDNADMTNAAFIAAKLRKTVENTPMSFNGYDFSTTITLGINTFRMGKTIEETIKGADIALYTGKKSGKNRIETFDESILESR